MELEQLKNLIKESVQLSKTYRARSQKYFDITHQYKSALIQTEESRTTLNQDENSLDKKIYSFDIDDDGQLVKSELACIKDVSEIKGVLSKLDMEIQGLKNAVKNYESSANDYELASSYFDLKNLQLEREYKVSAFGSSAGIIYDRLMEMKYAFVVIALKYTAKRLGLNLIDILRESEEFEKLEHIISEHNTNVKHGDIKANLLEIINNPENNIDIKVNQTKDIVKKVKSQMIKREINAKPETLRTYIQHLKGENSG